MVAIRYSDINSLTISRGAPLDSSEGSAWPNRCTPNDVPVIGIKCPKDAALLAKANNVTDQIRSRPANGRNLDCWVRDSSGLFPQKRCRLPSKYQSFAASSPI